MASTPHAQFKLGALVFGLILLTGCGAEPEERWETPDFRLESATIDDSELTNASLKGKVVLLDFWATWCQPCRESMPLIQKIHEELGPKGVQVIGVSADPLTVQRNYAKEHGFTYRFALDRGARAQGAFGFNAIPSIAVLSKDGKVAMSHTGLDFDWNEFVKKLEALNNE